MGTASGGIWFLVIALFYSFLGSVTVPGSIYLARQLFTPKAEQIFFGLFFSVIAGMYPVFAAYFGAHQACLPELTAAAAFAALGIIGCRISFVLIAGYALHGVWDGLHEFSAHAAGLPLPLTAIPLAYGFFCAAYDALIAVYFHRRRRAWRAAWAGAAA